ncbi:MAG: NAD-glutamate dehydrogenase domain-containing protein [Myxococcota bacterium]
MHRNVGREELIDELVPELRRAHEEETGSASDTLDAFSQAVLKRVDDKYLYLHRLTTLGAQLRDSFRWVTERAHEDAVHVRVFEPTLKDNGYELEGFVIETSMPDQPFIVDTMKLYTEQCGVRVINQLNVVMPASFDEDQLVAVGKTGTDVRLISYTRWYVTWRDGMTADDVKTAIEGRLALARASVSGFYRMVRLVKDTANEFEYLSRMHATKADDCLEVRDFLSWLVEDHYVFMGLTVYEFDADGNATIANQVGAVLEGDDPDATLTSITEFARPNETLSWPIVRALKSSVESRVHRAGKVDELVVRLFDDQGRVTGCAVIQGLFTFKGLSQPGSEIPILRGKLAHVIAEEDVVPGGYVHKGFVNAFNALPVEYLFGADLETVRDLLAMLVTADTTHEVKCQVVLSDDGHSAYAFVVIPKKHYSEDLRSQMEASLRDNLGASYTDHRVYLGKSGTVAVHFYLTGGRELSEANLDEVHNALVEIGTPWTYRLRHRLESALGESDAAGTYARYADAFPEGYTEQTPESYAVTDITHLESVLETGALQFEIFPHPTIDSEALIRIYSREPMQLTSILPVIDNFGVVVVEQLAFEVSPKEAPCLTVNTLRILRGDHDVLAQGKALLQGVQAVFARRMRSDRLNRLLLHGHLTWQEVDLFRGLYSYARQTANQPGLELIQKVLAGHSDYVSRLAEFFRVRFDPDTGLDLTRRTARQDELVAGAMTYLDSVQSFEEDRILRLFLNLMQSTLRTNFYRTRGDDEHFISMKLDCSMIRDLPEPRPLYEIYVHHARMEGVHLRGGRVARGGIRWSDRLDDYRSEVLGLMATQMLKNTVIVPVGAKGGFVLKDPIDDWSEARVRADTLYRIFIRGLLEVTDNLVEGDIVAPERVVRYDGDDPYLVVAADKGTAHLSDTANGVARDFGFWLDDAFASGGSVGYDHKIKGITARGAWVCVRHHFRELGLDPEIDPITVVGIGDMSGDVFGNGMLLSKTMRLLAAFNHRHIFLDPNPKDAGKSWKERHRLFELPRSQWTDYDAKLISKGGGVFDRGAKAISLSKEAREMLNTDAETLSGEEVIQHILRADVDLLWNGGIGTYVKAAVEQHHDVEDTANDRVRVDAEELRCRVVGEGGNLGITMRGRVEFASQGGRINLDAIDNSAGVDLSDHEVNIKILLSHAVNAGILDTEARVALLSEVGDWVCDLVLVNNATQSLAISLDEMRSRRDIWSIVLGMDFLKERLGFSRRGQRLPRDPRIIDGRIEQDQGFLRPELSKLLSYSKMFAFEQLGANPIGDKAERERWLRDYFPAAVVAVNEAGLGQYMLFDELAGTLQVNHIIDNAGVTFLPSMIASTERSVRDICTAYLLAEQLLDASSSRAAISAVKAELTAEQEYEAWLRIEDSIASAVRWLLALHSEPLTLNLAGLDKAKALVQVLTEGWTSMLPAPMARELRYSMDDLKNTGMPAEIAQMTVLMPTLSDALPIASLATELGHDSEALAPLYFAVGHGARVFQLAQAISAQTARVTWDQVAVASILQSLFDSVIRLTRLIASKGKSLPDPAKVEPALCAMSSMAAVRRDIEAMLPRHVPVSAMLVTSERLRRRIRDMENARG